MSGDIFLDSKLEQDLLARKKLAQEQISQGQNLDSGTVARLLDINRNFGWLAPSVQMGMAQQGLSASSPGASDIAQVSLKRQMRQQRIASTLHQIQNADDVAKIKDLYKNLPDNLSKQQTDAFKKAVGDRTVHLLSGGGGGGFLGTGVGPDVSLGDIGHSIGRFAQGDVRGAFSGQDEQVQAPVRAVPVVGKAIDEGSKAAVREVAAGASFPLEAVQGSVRNFAGGVSALAAGTYDPTNLQQQGVQSVLNQTTVGQQVNALAHGTDASLGNGLLPDPTSPVAQAAHQAQIDAAPTIAGHAFSIGRYVGAQVFQPDTVPFDITSGLIDAGVALKADPTALALKASSEDRAASKLFSPETTSTDETLLNEAGAYSKPRPWIASGRTGPTPGQWLNSPDGQTVVKSMVDKSAAELVRDYKIPAQTADGKFDVAKNLARALDSSSGGEDAAIQRANEVLGWHLGPDIVKPIKLPGGFSYSFSHGLGDAPFFNLIPGRYVDQTDPNQMFQALDGWMQTARIPIADRNKLLDPVLTSSPGSLGRGKAVLAVGDAITEHMVASGVDPEKAKELGRVFANADTSQRLYDMDQATQAERIRSGVAIDGAGHVLPEPQLTTEAMNRVMRLPDMRAVRDETSKLRPLVTSAPWQVPRSLMDGFTRVWRDVHLLRPALGLRVVGDSQLSLAASGYDSLFTHPINMIGGIIGANLDTRWGQFLAHHLAGIEGAADQVPVLGDRLANLVPSASMSFDAANQPMFDQWSNPEVSNVVHGAFAAVVDDPRKITLNDYLPAARGDAGYTRGLADELVRLGGDPRVRGIVNAASPEAAKDWFWSGEGAALREQAVPLSHTINESNIAKVAAGDASRIVPLDLESRSGSDQFVNDILNRVADTTGGHDAYRQAIASGMLDGVPLRGGQLGTVNDSALNKISEYAAQGVGPDAVKIRRTLMKDLPEQAADAALRQRVLRTMFHGLLEVPDQQLDRIPAYQQAYWHDAAQYLPYVSTQPITVGGEQTTLRDLILSRAKENGVSQRLIDRLDATVPDTGARKLSLDGFHTLTKHSAVDTLPDLVHDLSTRSHAFDEMRVLFPFGDAFRRIATRWAKIVWEHPAALRRVQQGVTVARQSGFFHTDPLTGQEVFTYPGSEFITDKLLGVPIPLTGQVGGLSMIGEGYPGFGPGITIPAQYLLPDTPGAQSVNNIVWPYGRPTNEGIPIVSDVLNSAIPPGPSRILQGLFDQYLDPKAYNNTVGSVMRYLASTGKYDIHGDHGGDPASESARLLKDAKDNARWFYVIRGVAQMGSPSSPAPDWRVQDKTGHLAVVAKIADDFRKQSDKLGPDGAMNWLLDQYGPNNLFVAQPFSKSLVYGSPITKQAQDWANAHPDVRSAYPNSYGFFAPQGGKFDISAFEAQFARGERTSLTPDDILKNANNRIGMWLYHQKKDQIIGSNSGDPVTKDQQAWLDKYKSALMDHFPGFNLVPYDDQKLPRTVNELTKAASDPNLAGTDAQAGLRDYLHFRAQATKEAQDSYGLKSPFKGKDARPLRDWLRTAADAVMKKHPAFAPMWEQVFSHELVSDGAPTEAPPGVGTTKTATKTAARTPTQTATLTSATTAQNVAADVPGVDSQVFPHLVSPAGRDVFPTGQVEVPQGAKTSIADTSGTAGWRKQLAQLQKQHPEGDVTVKFKQGAVWFVLPNGKQQLYRPPVVRT